MHQRIAQLIRTHGRISRAELARRSGFSKPTISGVVTELLAANLVVETGFAQSEGGRRGMLLRFNDHAGFVIGMDIGGTTARGSLATLRGDLLATLRQPTAGASPEALMTQIETLMLSLCDQARVPLSRVLGVAIGTPGAVDPVSSQVRYAPNLQVLETHDFATALAAQLGRPVSLHNDVNLAALGEQAAGAGRAAHTFAFVGVGTGLGFGLIVGGQLHRGSAGRAGELGYLRLTPQSLETIEDTLCGPGVARRHAAAGGSGEAAAAFDEAERGAEPGLGVVAELTEYLAWLLSALSTLLDPELLVLGGSIGQRFRAFAPRLTRSFEQLSPITPPLTFSELGDDAGLYGAVAVALAEAEPQLYGGGEPGTQTFAAADIATP